MCFRTLRNTPCICCCFLSLHQVIIVISPAELAEPCTNRGDTVPFCELRCLGVVCAIPSSGWDQGCMQQGRSLQTKRPRQCWPGRPIRGMLRNSLEQKTMKWGACWRGIEHEGLHGTRDMRHCGGLLTKYYSWVSSPNITRVYLIVHTAMLKRF